MPAGCSQASHGALTRHLCVMRRCGAVESVRLRSVAVDPEAKVPHRAAVLTGQRNAAVSSVNGYVVFQSTDGARLVGASSMLGLV